MELAAKIGVDIIAIRRRQKWLIDPSEKERVVEGDVLIVRGAPHGVDELKDIAEGKIKELE